MLNVGITESRSNCVWMCAASTFVWAGIGILAILVNNHNGPPQTEHTEIPNRFTEILLEVLPVLNTEPAGCERFYGVIPGQIAQLTRTAIAILWHTVPGVDDGSELRTTLLCIVVIDEY